MAALWNVTGDLNSPDNMNQLPEDLKSKLMLIDCELLYGKDDWWMSEVLFTPSEYHLDFLQWILTNFNESLEKYFKQPQSNLDSPHEVQAQRILKLCSNLGLCDAKDENLIKGKAPYNQLLSFWQHLIDIFLIKTQRHKVKLDYECSPKNCLFSSKGHSLEKQLNTNTKMLNSICERNFYGNEAFKVNSNIIPSDLLKKMNLQNEIPNGETLKSNFSTVMNNYAWQQQEVEEMKKNANYNIFAEKDATSTNITQQNINLVLSDLEKMALQFTRCHEDLKPWLISEKQSKFTSLGQKFQEACDKLQEFTNALNQLSSLKTNYEELDNIDKSTKNDAEHYIIKDYFGPACDILT